MKRLTIALFLVAPVLLLADQQRPVFRTSVLGVGVPVSVWRGRQPVRDLTAADFELTDNGVTQEITVVDGTEVPLDTTVVLQETHLPVGIEVGTFSAELAAAARSTRTDDELHVLLAGEDQRERTLPLKDDLVATARLERRCRPIYDALARAFIRQASIDRQRVIVLIGQGEGSGSFHFDDSVTEIARRSSARLYVVTTERATGVTTFRNSVAQPVCARLEADWSMERRAQLRTVELIPDASDQFTALWREGKKRLAQLAEETGGREIDSALFTTSFARPLAEAFDEVRTSYILRYTPTGVPDAGWHRLSLTVKRAGRYEIRMRPGYQR